MNYDEFIHAKALTVENSGFDIDTSELNPKLFGYQEHGFDLPKLTIHQIIADGIRPIYHYI